jgi:cytochrome c peroxidase
MRVRTTGIAVFVVAGAAAVAGSIRADTPVSPDPAALAARVELGRRLFFEPAVSRAGRVSCGSCHDPAHGFTDVKHPSQDEWGPTSRRTMPLADLPKDGPFHADGEFARVRELLDRRFAPLEVLRELNKDGSRPAIDRSSQSDETSIPSSYGMGKADPPVFLRVTDRLASDGFYARAFTAAFGDATPKHDRVCDAIEAFLGSLRTSTNSVDRFLAGDDAALAKPAARGLALFTGKAGCAQCHDTRAAADGRAPMRDGKFHDTGVAVRSARAGGDADDADAGLGAHGGSTADRRRDKLKFKTPSLRDVARRGPFMHDGSLASLVDVVAFYDRGGARHDGLDPLIRPLGLTDAEKDDLVAFLFALSGDTPAGTTSSPAKRTVRLRLVGPDGAPLAGTLVAAEPAGGTLGASAPSAGPAVVTDQDGRARIEFPASTHARLAVAHAVVTELVPDCADSAEVIAVPATHVALRIRAAAGQVPDSIRAVPVAKVNGKGRTIQEKDDGALEFRLARKLSESEGLYVAPAPAGGIESSRRLLLPSGSGGGALNAVVDTDLRGGATTRADLTPLRDAPKPQDGAAR